ncbi:MAG: hypothetical protein JXR73_08945 [Candidatus Omnitrophica bacterium]|nr:hypothetical protein [Candidatus Omnitrophota bacterium]
MSHTFAYDLVGFLRVLYRRRGMIIKGTIAVTVLTAVAALIWPQTWRADARIFVSTPKYKETLRLVSKPFDVLTYESVMASDQIYMQIIDALEWYREAVHSLKDNPEYLQRINEHLQSKAAGMTIFEKMQNSNLEILTEFLAPSGLEDDLFWKNRIYMFGHLSAEELQTIYDAGEDELDDLTVFDLRKMLSTSVAKVRETNLEVEYSRVIRVSAEFDTAAGAKMVANTWLDLFLARAEEMVRGTIQREIQLSQNRSLALQSDLQKAESILAEYEREANVGQLRAELASQLVHLTGMTPNRRIADQVEESFNLESEDEPFMKERREKADSLSYTISPQYENALLPMRLRIEGERNIVEALLKKQHEAGAASSTDLLSHKTELDATLSSLKDQIKSVSHDIAALWDVIRRHESEIEQLRRHVNEYQSALTAMRPLLDEAALLQSRDENIRYADVSIDRPIKPDKRVFPKRTFMTAIGLVLSFFLWCCMAFFLDIWEEVVKPDGESAPGEE